MRKAFSAVIVALAIAAMTGSPAEATPKVVVSIMPIHSLVAGVMDGVAAPTLLVPPGASPHTYALKPSDARALQSSDVVFWIGEDMEMFLEKPLVSLAGKARIVELAATPNLMLHAARKGGLFDVEEHADHQDAQDDNDNDNDHGHGHGETDMHVWLDPNNARRIVAHAVTELSAVDPAKAARYARNGEILDSRIDALDRELKVRLAPVRDRAYIVFHDAYQYFERHYGTRIAGAVTVSPEQPPGARRISELRARIQNASATCVFREPQFDAPIMTTLLEGTDARMGVLDPEGADLTPGPDAWFMLMDRIANSLADCLKSAS